MIFDHIRAVVIDDEPEDLMFFMAGLAAAGIPSAAHWYDRSEAEVNEKLKPKLPADGYPYLRVIVSDLNLDEIHSKSISEVMGPVILVIKNLVSTHKGPYLLIFWTATSFKLDEIRAFLPDRLRAIGVPEPIGIEEMNKGNYLKPGVAGKGSPKEQLVNIFRQAESSSEALRNGIHEILRSNRLLAMLSAWESRAARAASLAVDGLFAVSVADAQGPADVPDAATRIAALISREAVGKTHATSAPSKAFDAAMFDVLVDCFGKSNGDEDYANLATEVIKPLLNKEPLLKKAVATTAALNAQFQLDFSVTGVSFRDRGAVFDLPEGAKHGLSIEPNKFVWDDFLWRPEHIDVASTPHISDGVFSAVSGQLRDSAEGAKQFEKAVADLKAQRRLELKKSRENFDREKHDIEKALKWVLIEIGADCDHAQGKTRSARYLVGLELPLDMARRFAYDHQGKMRNEALRCLGPYSGKPEYRLFVSLKRYVSWQINRPEELPAIPVRYRLRKAIVDELLHRYASWSSRPGVVEFKVDI